MSRITDPKVQAAAVSALTHASPALHDDDAYGSTPPARDSDAMSTRSRHTLRAFNADNDDDDDDEDPWSAMPRPLSSSGVGAASPAELSQLTRAQRKQLLLRALLQLLALFVVCLVGLGGTLWLALPVISPEDKPNFKLPRSFDDLKSLNTVLQHYKNDHFARVLLCWIAVYMFLQAFSVPGSMYMSILAGALFGVPIALPLVCASVATGATICYLISKTLGVVLVAIPSWKARIDQWKDKLAEHEDNMLSYLVVIRMMPLPPHNIVNILAPHLGIGIPLFWVSTFGGVFAVSVIHTTIGEKLDQMTSADDFNLFSLRNVLLLAGVCVAVLLPVAIKRFSKVDALETSSNDGRGALYLEDGGAAVGAGEEDAERLPDSFRPILLHRGSGFDDEESEDELPRRNLDTHNILATAQQYDEGAAQESFPSWRDRSSDNDEDEEDDEEEEGLEEHGRGGVFADRTTLPTSNGNGTATPVAQGKRGKLQQWLGGSSRIQL